MSALVYLLSVVALGVMVFLVLGHMHDACKSCGLVDGHAHPHCTRPCPAGTTDGRACTLPLRHAGRHAFAYPWAKR